MNKTSRGESVVVALHLANVSDLRPADIVHVGVQTRVFIENKGNAECFGDYMYADVIFLRLSFFAVYQSHWGFLKIV